MADEADIANDQAERWLEGRLEEFRYQQEQERKKALESGGAGMGDGRCKNCSDKLDDGRAYCNEDCRNDHWKRICAERRGGRYKGG